MQVSLRRFLLASLVFSILFAWADPSNNLALAISASVAVATLVLVTTQKLLPKVLGAAAGCVGGILFFGPMLSDTVFSVRDGNYFLDSVLPGKIAGLTSGWLIAIVVIRIPLRFADARRLPNARLNRG